MGLAETFGWNGVADWIDPRRNMMMGLGAGIASGTNLSQGIANGLQMGAQGRMQDDAFATAKKEEAARQEQLNRTMEWIRSNQPDLAGIAEVDPNRAFELALERMQPQGQAKPIEINGQLVDPNTYEVLGDFRTPETGSSNMPALVQEYEYAKSQGYEGSLIDYQQAKGRNSGTPPATIAKEIFEADEGAQAGQNVINALDRALELNKTAGDGPLADSWSSVAALAGDPQAVQTQELKNIVTANALESLKATFGAAPTEGERKILIEIQGSVNQSRPVREAIFKRAKAAAERRMKFNQERGAALRGGNYFDPGYSPVGGATAGNQTSTGVTWSIEP